MTTPTDGRGAWRKFICQACGHIYDEALGNPDEGLPAGTRFEDIADDWRCPLCGASKHDFELYDESESLQSATAPSRQHGIVIVGAGLAGWSVVDALRALDKDIPITLICGDSGDRYHKPMLSAAISQGKTAADLVRMTATQSAHDNCVRLLSHTTVTHIDTTTKTLHTAQREVCYDDLVLAIGATPAYPPTISQADTWHINNLEQFSQLQQHLQSAPKHIAIIGAGMVGTEFAEDLINAGHQVSLIDVNAQPLSAMLPTIATERILSAITNKGINWLGEQLVSDIIATDTGHALLLRGRKDDQEQQVTVDEVVVATGLVVDAHLPNCAGLAFDERTGIVVNPSTLQTSVPHIYALGDCISIDDVPCRYVAPHRAQAAAIAHEILGLEHAGYDHKAPMIRLKNKSISVTANGNPRSAGDWRITKDADGELSLEMYDGDNLIAKALIKTPQG